MIEMWIPIIVAIIAACPGFIAVFSTNKTNSEIENLSKKLESKNNLKRIYYCMELNVYPELMKGITAYRWIILEPGSNPSNEETFDFEDWIKRYDDSLNEVRDCLDINCAFISKELNQKIEGLQELGSDMSLHAVFN